MRVVVCHSKDLHIKILDRLDKACPVRYVHCSDLLYWFVVMISVYIYNKMHTDETYDALSQPASGITDAIRYWA